MRKLTTVSRNVAFAINFAAIFYVCSASPALAQSADSFPDVPANHWVFEALARLKTDGLLKGEPDGLFRGSRLLSRYEMGAAVHSAYLALKNSTEGLGTAAQNLVGKLDSMQPVTKDDLDQVGRSVAALNTKLGDAKGYGDDVKRVSALVTEFKSEIEAMGIDLGEVKKGLSALDDRVERLEKGKLPVDVKGNLDTVMLGGYSSGHLFGLTVDGRPTGVAQGADTSGSLDNAAKAGLTKDAVVLHELAITLTDNLHTDPTWRIIGVVGNMVGPTAFGGQNVPESGVPFTAGGEAIYIQNASVKFEGNIKRLPYRVEMGRFNHRDTPYTFQRPDSTPYFTNDRWDNGAWTLDGATLRIGEGTKSADFFVGRTASESSVGGGATPDDLGAGRALASSQVGNAIQTMRVGSPRVPFNVGVDRPIGQVGSSILPVDQVIGFNARMPFLKTLTAKFSYINLQSNSQADFGDELNHLVGNTVAVFGASIEGKLFGVVPIHGSFAKSNVMYNSANVLTHDNEAIDLGIAGTKGLLGLKAGYRAIGPNFGAPGDWGRIGMWWNPTDINDFYVLPSLGIGRCQLTAEAHVASGQGKGSYDGRVCGCPTIVAMGKDDHNVTWTFSLNYKLGGGNQALVGIESTDWNMANHSDFGTAFQGGKPKEKWYDFGLSSTKKSTTFSVIYQISDYNSNGVAGFAPFGASSAQTSAHGGILVTQLSSRF